MKHLKILTDNQISFRQYLLLIYLNNQIEESVLNNYYKIDPIKKTEIDFLLDNDLIINLEIDDNDNKGYLLSKLKITDNGIILINENQSDFNDFVNEWYNLWPTGIKSGGYYIKTSKLACSKNLKKFFKEHPEYTQEIVLKATKKYLEDMERQSYKYIKLAPYFIYKDSISTLESCCMNYNNIDEVEDPFKNNV
jgi:hypothetical protein